MKERDNNWWMRFVSIEMLGLIFVAGMSWAGISYSQATIKEQVEQQEGELAEVKETVGDIKIDVEVIRNSQEYMKADIAEQKEAQKETNRMLRELLSNQN
jgi:hypothetical protein